MPLPEFYFCPKVTATSTEVIKRSKFISVVGKVESEAACQEFLSNLRKLYPDALHYVYAYRVLDDKPLERYSDDGEPAGTGGLPCLKILQKHQLWQTIVAVVRYFGGILLGTGGLLRAYSGGAEAALKKANWLCYEKRRHYQIKLTYTSYDLILRKLQQQGFTASKIDYAELVTADFLLSPATCELFTAKLEEISAGKVSPLILSNACYVPNIDACDKLTCIYN